MVFTLSAVIGEASHPGGQAAVPGQDCPPVSESPEVFAREEAGGSDSTEHPRGCGRAIAAPGRAQALGVVFHKVQAVFFSPGHQSIHVGALPKQMHHHHRLRPGRSGALGGSRIKLERRGVDVRKNGGSPNLRDDLRRSNEREVGNDDLISGAHTERAQGQGQGVGPVSASHDVAVEVEGAVEFGLKCIHVLATDEGRFAQHVVHGTIQLGTKPRMKPT